MNEERRARLHKLMNESSVANIESPSIILERTHFEVNLALVDAVEALQDQILVSTTELEEGLNQSVSRMITANERLAESNDKHSVAMVRLTYALVFVGIVQAFAALFQAFQ